MARETKSQLKQRVEDLKAKLREAEQRAEAVEIDTEELETAKRERDVARKAERKLRGELEAAKGRADNLDRELAEATAELSTALDRVAALEEGRGSACDEDHEDAIRELQDQRDEARDDADRKQWEVEQLKRDLELETMRAKESARGELQVAHALELQTRDDLVRLLKSRVAELEKQLQKSSQEATASQGGVEARGGGSSRSPGTGSESSASSTLGSEGVNSGPPTRKLTLPPLPKFTGEKADEDAFERWSRRLLRHAELEKWTDHEKLLQLEIHLAGRAEQVYEVLPSESRSTFSKAVEALKQRLHPVKSEALLSAQLMRRKQQYLESVDQYAQEFECLFEKSYGRRAGMDTSSKVMLKRDLFVQGLILKWQKKVLPSAATFSDALHQARLAEEQHRQLDELHKGRQLERPQPKKTTEKTADPGNAGGDDVEKQTSSILPSSSTVSRPLRCFKCGSLHHKARECPLRQPPTESPGRAGTRTATSSTVTAAHNSSPEPLRDRCLRLQKEWTTAEHQRMTADYQTYAKVGKVTGAIGPLFYATVRVEGVPLQATLDPGSSATIIPYSLFREIGKKARIPAESLQPPDITLRDYNQGPILVGARVELTFAWKDRAVTTPAYIRSELTGSNDSCLLGTNVIVPLGLMEPDQGVEAREGAELIEPATVSEAQVHLVGAARIPSRSAVVVTAEIRNLSEKQLMLFEPDDTWLAESRLQVEDSLLDLDETGQVSLVIHNPTGESLRLDAGDSIGVATACLDPDQPEGAVSEIAPMEEVSDVQVNLVHPECTATSQAREKELSRMLDIGTDQLTPEEVAKVRSCVLQAHDIFAVEKSELENVSEVQHRTETAISKPVDRPDQDPIRVNLDRVSKCSCELPDVSWLGPRTRQRRRRKPRQSRRQAGERLPETDQDGTRVTRGRVKKRRRVL